MEIIIEYRRICSIILLYSSCFDGAHVRQPWRSCFRLSLFRHFISLYITSEIILWLHNECWLCTIFVRGDWVLAALWIQKQHQHSLPCKIFWKHYQFSCAMCIGHFSMSHIWCTWFHRHTVLEQMDFKTCYWLGLILSIDGYRLSSNPFLWHEH